LENIVNESVAITYFLAAPTGVGVQYFSSLYKGLVDCRSATNRDLETGEKLPSKDHDSWLGALGYLVLVDLVGTCLTRKHLNQESPNSPPFISALEAFGGLSREEISALYALRCAFAHDFSLYNVHPRKPELTHYFQLRIDADAPLVLHAKRQWDGDYRHTPAECATAIGLTRIGDLVEDIYVTLQRLAKSQDLKVKLPGGALELIDRYGVMKTPKSMPILESHGPL
jgi:hypothetical protein